MARDGQSVSEPHPLDRQIWSALNGRQKPLSSGDARARRLDPALGPFAATVDETPESYHALAALTRGGPDIALFTHAPPPASAAFASLMSASLDQFVGIAPAREAARTDIVRLGAADAAEMLALADLTKPGPFLIRTHELGAFFGVRVDGRLAGHRGERLKPDGHTEITAVCTHPDFRGRGLAAALIRRVAEEIAARGETPFLHVFSHNAPAIAVYERLGMKKRRSFIVTRLSPR